MRKFSWFTNTVKVTDNLTVYQYAVDREIFLEKRKDGSTSFILVKKGTYVTRHDGGWQRYKPNLKGGHTHNHQRNALKRMRRCRGCDKHITKYEGFKSHFSGHICMECHVENCLEHASMVGISIQWPLFEELYNPYIRRK